MIDLAFQLQPESRARDIQNPARQMHRTVGLITQTPTASLGWRVTKPFHVDGAREFLPEGRFDGLAVSR